MIVINEMPNNLSYLSYQFIIKVNEMSVSTSVDSK